MERVQRQSRLPDDACKFFTIKSIWVKLPPLIDINVMKMHERSFQTTGLVIVVIKRPLKEIRVSTLVLEYAWWLSKNIWLSGTDCWIESELFWYFMVILHGNQQLEPCSRVYTYSFLRIGSLILTTLLPKIFMPRYVPIVHPPVLVDDRSRLNVYPSSLSGIGP